MAEEPDRGRVRLDLVRVGVEEEDAVATAIQNRFQTGPPDLHLLEETIPFLLGSLALGDVLDRTDDADRLSSPVALDTGFLMDVASRAVRANDAIINSAGVPRRQGFRSTLDDPRAVVGMDGLLDRLQRQVEGVGIDSKDPIDLVGPVELPCPQVAPPVAEVGDFLGAGEALLASAQRRFGSLALGNILKDRDGSDDTSCLVAERTRARQDHPLSPVVVADPDFHVTGGFPTLDGPWERKLARRKRGPVRAR
jgi:hypothetical protein